MSQSYKERVMGALKRHHQKQLEQDQPPQRKNGKPEKLVEAKVLKWSKANGLMLKVYESKAKFVPGKGYRGQAVVAGHSDLAGNDAYGHSVFVELKALGKRSTLSGSQRNFLEKKIKSNCFGCVTDRVEHLSALYGDWLRLRTNGELIIAREILMDDLPKQREDNDGLGLGSET